MKNDKNGMVLAAATALICIAWLFASAASAEKSTCESYYRSLARAALEGKAQSMPHVITRVEQCIDESEQEASLFLDLLQGIGEPPLSGKTPRRLEDIYANLDRYDDIILAEAERQGVDPNLLKAMILVESAFNAGAVSHAGAMGLMQLMPGTAKDLGVVEPFDPEQNIWGGTRYIKLQMDTFGGDLDLALAAYNAGPTAVGRCQCVPNNSETPGYVSKAKKYYTYFSTERPVGAGE